MGLYDRDYASGHEPGFHVQAPKTITTQLVLITAVVYALQCFVKPFSDWFSLYSDWFQQPWTFFQLLSYGFLHDVEGIEHILFKTADSDLPPLCFQECKRTRSADQNIIDSRCQKFQDWKFVRYFRSAKYNCVWTFYIFG